MRISDWSSDVCSSDLADAAIILVDHEQLFDPALVEQTARILLRDSRLHSRQIVAGPQFRDGMAHLFGKEAVEVGEDAHQLARKGGGAFLNNRIARNIVDRKRVGKGKRGARREK